MSPLPLLFAVLIVIGTADSASAASSYQLTVTRKEKNLYKVTGKDLFIVTKYCYEYVYYADAILRTSGVASELIFVDQHSSCMVKAVYGPAEIKPGRYSVTISHEDDDWYEVVGKGMFIRTSMCLSLALADEAILTTNAFGGGELLFVEDEDECSVEGVYTPVELDG